MKKSAQIPALKKLMKDLEKGPKVEEIKAPKLEDPTKKFKKLQNMFKKGS